MSWHQHCTKFSVCNSCGRWARIDWHKCRNCGERYTLRAPTEKEVEQYKQMTQETQLGPARFVRELRRTAAMNKAVTDVTVNQFLALTQWRAK